MAKARTIIPHAPRPYPSRVVDEGGDPGPARETTALGTSMRALFRLLRRLFGVEAAMVVLRSEIGGESVFHDGMTDAVISAAHVLRSAIEPLPTPRIYCDTTMVDDGMPLSDHLRALPVGFFAAVALNDHHGNRLGALCLAHSTPLAIDPDASLLLQDAASLAVREVSYEIAERIAQNSWETLVEAIETLPDGFVLYDQEDRLKLCNEQYRKVYPESADVIKPGRTFEEIIREGVRRGQYCDAIGREEAWIAERLAAHANPEGAIEQLLPDGRWLRVHEKRLPNGGVVGFRVDITELKQRQAELYDLAHRDELTGVMSRRAILSAARSEADVAGDDGQALGLMIVDIDHFKRVNDRFGHFAADDVLIEFSHRIQRLLRTDDSFGRVGGEEFLAVLPRTSPRDAVGIGERLRAALCCKPFSVNGQPIVVTMSAGVTSFHPGETIDEAFARADRLLYDAKQSGRNKVISNITL